MKLSAVFASVFGFFVALVAASQVSPRVAVRPGAATATVKIVAQATSAPTGAYLAQAPGPVATSTGGAISVTIPSSAPSGDMMMLFVVSATPIPVPSGFSTPAASFLGSPSPGPLQVFYGVVGQNGLVGATSYSLGSGNMIMQLFDIAGENQVLAPSFSIDISATPPPTAQVSRNETVLTAQGLTFSAFGGSASTRENWLPTPPAAIFSDTPPGGVTETPAAQLRIGTTTGTTFGLALAINIVTSEAFTATPNPFTVIGQFAQKPIFGGTAVYDGVVLTVLPAPSPTPTTNLATPPAGKFYISARYNELSGNNGTYDQPTVVNFETDISHRLAINSHFHFWTDVFPWANSTSSPYLDSMTRTSPLPATSPFMVPYNLANTDEQDDAVNGRYVLSTWNCGDTDWNVAHGIDDAQIIASVYRFAAYGKPIFLRYFHEMNLESSSDNHTPCLDGLTSPNPVPSDYPGSSANLSGDTTPNPLVMPTTLGYFNPGEWKAAWIHVHDLVRSIAPNVNFVFVPSGGGMSDGASFDPHLYYPGDQYVEWIGFDDYERRTYGNFDDFSGGTPAACQTAGPTPGPTYYCPNTIYTEVTGSSGYTQVPWATPSPKPLFVAETAALPTNQPNWLALSSGRSIIAQTLATNYPQVAALSYFDQTGAIDWVLTGAPVSPTPSPTPSTGYALFAALAGDTNSAAGPTPSPLPTSTASGFTINHGPIATSTGSSVTASASAPPSPGDTLIVALVTADAIPAVPSPLAVPTNWNVLTNSGNGHLETAYCYVGSSSSDCSTTTTSYAFGATTDGGMAQIYDIKGANALPPAAATDNPNALPTGLRAINEQVSNLTIPISGGFTMTIWSGEAADTVLNYPGTATDNPNGLYQIYPSYGTRIISPIASMNIPLASGFYASLITYIMNRETESSVPFTAAARYFNNIPGPGPAGVVNSDGTIIWKSGAI